MSLVKKVVELGGKRVERYPLLYEPRPSEYAQADEALAVCNVRSKTQVPLPDTGPARGSEGRAR